MAFSQQRARDHHVAERPQRPNGRVGPRLKGSTFDTFAVLVLPLVLPTAPHEVRRGLASEMRERRAAVLDAAFLAHP